MDSQLEVIDAFVDGERVDPVALKRALAEAEGRDYFVDAWTLREAVQQDREGVSRDARAPGGVPVATPRPRAIGRWLVAAAMVVCVAGGYFAGNRTADTTPPAAPPVVTTTATAATAAKPARPAFPAPPPTRVIQLEFQVDANRGGGH